MRITHFLEDPWISLLGFMGEQHMVSFAVVSVPPATGGVLLWDEWPDSGGSESVKWNWVSGQAHGPGPVEQEG